MEGLSNVEDLDVSLNFNDLRDWGVLTVAKGIFGMKSVRKLRLGLNQNEVQNEGALQFGDLVAEKASGYEYLEVDFTGTAINNATAFSLKNKFEGVENVLFKVNSVITEDYEKKQQEKENS